MTRKRLDVARLHSALDFVRAHRRISWKTIADETGLSASTLTRLGQGHAPDADGLCALMAWLGDGLPLSRFTIDDEPIEHDITTFGDAARGVRVYLRPDGSSREEPWNAQ